MICLVCDKELKSMKGLATHIAISHSYLGIEQYYIKYINKKEGVSSCLSCNNKTTFLNITKGYSRYCSNKCANTSIEVRKLNSLAHIGKIREDMIGDNNVAKRKNVREKISAALKGNQHTKGFKFSDEQCLNVSNAIKKSWIGAVERKLSVKNPDSNNTYKSGKYYSAKNSKKLHYRSSYELKVYELLDFDDEVVSYTVEELAIPYTFNGSNRHYIPDLLVKYKNGNIAIIEIKPERKTGFPQNIAKFEAGREYAKNENIVYEVWTEKQIFKKI